MGDSISRQNAIEGVKELFACADIGNDECDIIYMLENLPSADEPTWEWIEDHSGSLYCPKGGRYLTNPQKENYCPNCGAKMKSGTE